MFWLSYESFSIFSDVFLIKKVSFPAKTAAPLQNSYINRSSVENVNNYLFQSLFVEAECLIVQQTTVYCIFAQVGSKEGNFQRFQPKCLRTTGFQLKFLTLIEFPNILHWKPTKKESKWVWPWSKIWAKICPMLRKK